MIILQQTPSASSINYVANQPVKLSSVTESSSINNETIGIIIGAIVSFLVVVLVISVWYLKYRRKQKSYDMVSRNGTGKSGAFTRRLSDGQLRKYKSTVVKQAFSSDSNGYKSWERNSSHDSDYIGGRKVSRSRSAYIKPNFESSLEYDSSDDDGVNTHSNHLNNGKLWFTIKYTAETDSLLVTVVKARFIPVHSKLRTPRDPYVIVYLLPDESHYQQSKTLKRTFTPKFNETFLFENVKKDDLRSRTVRFSMYDLDSRNVRHSVGHVRVTLDDIDIEKGETLCREMEKRAQPARLGELNFGLTYLPTTEKIKVTILRARNLKRLNSKSDSGFYCQVNPFLGRTALRSKRTTTIPGTLEPIYNECFSFTVQPRFLDKCHILVTVHSTKSGLISNRDCLYGQCSVGSYLFAKGERAKHWREAISKPRSMIAMWHEIQTGREE